METNLEELLNNTNLTPVEILESYLEEIDARFDEFNANFWKFIPYYKNGNIVYYHILQEKALEKPLLYDKLINMAENIGTLVNEFLSLYTIIEKNYKMMIYDLVSEKNDSLEFLKVFINSYLYGVGGLSDYTKKVHDCLKILIMYVKAQEEKEKISEKERLNEDKLAILEFYVNEFNRELDEKETKIYELETAKFQDEQDINALINENNELRRVLEINREGEE